MKQLRLNQKKKGGFFSMILGTLANSLLVGNMLADTVVIGAVEETIRVDQNF